MIWGRKMLCSNRVPAVHMRIRQQFDLYADPFTAKRQSLYLTRRGGKGEPNFVSPFLGGAGTTCGEWTRPMVRNADGTVIKGFLKASVAVGFCPVACRTVILTCRTLTGWMWRSTGKSWLTNYSRHGDSISIP